MPQIPSLHQPPPPPPPPPHPPSRSSHVIGLCQTWEITMRAHTKRIEKCVCICACACLFWDLWPQFKVTDDKPERRASEGDVKLRFIQFTLFRMVVKESFISISCAVKLVFWRRLDWGGHWRTIPLPRPSLTSFRRLRSSLFRRLSSRIRLIPSTRKSVALTDQILFK